MGFEIQPGNQNPLETGYCPKFLLYHLFGEVIDDAFLFGKSSRSPILSAQCTVCLQVLKKYKQLWE